MGSIPTASTARDSGPPVTSNHPFHEAPASRGPLQSQATLHRYRPEPAAAGRLAAGPAIACVIGEAVAIAAATGQGAPRLSTADRGPLWTDECRRPGVRWASRGSAGTG